MRTAITSTPARIARQKTLFSRITCTSCTLKSALAALIMRIAPLVALPATRYFFAYGKFYR